MKVGGLLKGRPRFACDVPLSTSIDDMLKSREDCLMIAVAGETIQHMRSAPSVRLVVNMIGSVS